MLGILFWGVGHAHGYGVIEKVSTSSGDDGAIIRVDVKGYTSHKVIPFGKTETLIAFKDTHVSDQVYAYEAIVGDPWIKDIEVGQRPFNVAALVVRLQRPDAVLDFNMEKDKGLSHIKFHIRVTAAETAKKEVLTDLHADEKPRPEEDKTNPRAGDTGGSSESEHNASPDGKLFQQAVKHQENGEWDKAVALYEKIIRAYPRSPHLEDSYFRAADTTYNQFREEISEHLLDISKRYQRAISRFPKSEHVPGARLSLGKVYARAGQHFEAIRYYDLVLDQDAPGPEIPQALLNKGKVLARTQRPLMALRCFEKVTATYGSTEVARQAKLEMAKALHEMKSFRQSMGILDELVSDHPGAVYEDADILRYRAYNYYELGKLEAARDVFSKVINYFPNADERDLMLARIADTFREEGFDEKATKLYSLVARTYPGSEAGIVSLLRLGEIAEKQETQQPLELSEAALPENPKTSKTASRIYRQIVETYPESPLSEVALLKLAGLQKRRKDYEKCVETLKELLAKHPDTQLKGQVEQVMRQATVDLAARYREEGRHEKSVETMAMVLAQYPDTRFTLETVRGLEESLVRVLEEKRDVEGAKSVVGYYEKRKELIVPTEMPEAALIVGMACKELYLCEYAISMLSSARECYPDEGLPAEYLLALGECGYREKKYKLATEVLDRFISLYPRYSQVSRAHLWLGNIFVAQEKYEKARALYEQGLERAADQQSRSRLLAAMGKALNGIGNHKKAITAFGQALSILEGQDGGAGDTDDIRFTVYKALGDTYFKTGENKKAVVAFEQALQVMPKEMDGYGLRFEIAKCYRSIAPRKAETVLNEIVASGDPFWSKVAQAQINDIDVERSVGTLGLNKS